MLAEQFRTKTRDEWAAVFSALDACVAPVLTLEEALTHPHNLARGSFASVDGAPMPGPAPRFSATPASVGEVSDVGGDTAALLAEAGYAEPDLDELRTAGVID